MDLIGKEGNKLQYFDYDDETDQVSIKVIEKVDALLDLNKHKYNDESHKKHGIKNGWMHFATIPTTMIYKFKSEYGLDIHNPDHRKKIIRLLHDPDYRYLRTSAGKFYAK